MRPPRGQDRSLVEASRLLQEGLQLLEERRREVDALVRQAHERAREVVVDAERQAARTAAEAEQRAAMTTADAERRRVELEEELATLRAEVEALRQELARGRGGSRGGRGGRPASSRALEATSAPDSGPELVASLPQPVESTGVVNDTAGMPRWGRPSAIGDDPQPGHPDGSRPSWLRRWLPFLLLVVLIGASALFASLGASLGSAS